MPVDIAQVTSRLADAPSGAVTLTPIAYGWGSPATAGLWRAAVTTPDRGETTYFVKLLRHPRLWPGLVHVPEGELRDFFVRNFPWRFELDMALSGIADVLPPGMRTPILHHHEAFDDDHIGLWWEFVKERPGPWTHDELRRAARLLGRLAARRRAGAEVNERLPETCRIPAGASLRYLVEGRVLHDGRADLADDRLWAHPLVAEALRGTGDVDLREDLRAHFPLVVDVLDELDRLPQTYAHGDASIQNILVCEGEEDFVVIDWGFGSLLAVGFDLGQLLVGSMHAGLVPAADIARIDPVIFDGYLQGLADEGYAVDPDDVRFGYLGSLFVRSVFTALPTAELRGDASDSLRRSVLERVDLTRAMLDLTGPVVRRRLARVDA
ncbi:phosphotransferase [Terrabacter sp. NPDC080008]|uniref:phosphotransferase n=1 Tax=Terrabacter sp. NPDC080008 TaxID=3155176 RepID=UPI00344EF8AE